MLEFVVGLKMPNRRDMNLNIIGILLIFLSSVVAPPPLDVELKAEKEYLEQLKEFRDYELNVVDDIVTIASPISNIIEKATDIDDEIVIKKDESGVFVPISLPNRFDKYDLNKDNFIDEGELIFITGLTENNNLAMKAVDFNGKLFT